MIIVGTTKKTYDASWVGEKPISSFQRVANSFATNNGATGDLSEQSLMRKQRSVPPRGHVANGLTAKAMQYMSMQQHPPPAL